MTCVANVIRRLVQNINVSTGKRLQSDEVVELEVLVQRLPVRRYDLHQVLSVLLQRRLRR